jgi:hypothetical protein
MEVLACLFFYHTTDEVRQGLEIFPMHTDQEWRVLSLYVDVEIFTGLVHRYTIEGNTEILEKRGDKFLHKYTYRDNEISIAKKLKNKSFFIGDILSLQNPYFSLQSDPTYWRIRIVVECTPLERVQAGNCLKSSNLLSSAIVVR